MPLSKSCFAYGAAAGFAAGAAAGIGLAHLWTPSFCSPKKSGISLLYWNGRGLMEVPRMMLAMAGMFPGDYENRKFWGEAKGSIEPVSAIEDQMDANFGRMPILKVGDVSIGQSVAINYYIAKATGLLGSSVLEAAQILSIQEHLTELGKAYRDVFPYMGPPPTEEALEDFFTQGAEDYAGKADGSKRAERKMKWFVKRLEGVVGEDGFAVGGKPSMADVLIYRTFGETIPLDQTTLEEKSQYKTEPFGSKAKMDRLLGECPKLKAIIDKVESNPGIKKWLEIRCKDDKYAF